MSKIAAGNDVSISVFAEMLCYLEPHPEQTEKLHRWKKPYTSEKAHMCLWFRSQETTGSGSYTRSAPNSSARVTYNRLLCPGAMLWIAEVLGETPERLREAAKAARESEKRNWRERGDGFREVIPFDRIYELYQQPENWKYDKRLLPYMRKGEDGYPVPIKNTFWRVVNKELQ